MIDLCETVRGNPTIVSMNGHGDALSLVQDGHTRAVRLGGMEYGHNWIWAALSPVAVLRLALSLNQADRTWPLADTERDSLGKTGIDHRSISADYSGVAITTRKGIRITLPVHEPDRYDPEMHEPGKDAGTPSVTLTVEHPTPETMLTIDGWPSPGKAIIHVCDDDLLALACWTLDAYLATGSSVRDDLQAIRNTYMCPGTCTVSEDGTGITLPNITVKFPTKHNM